MVSQNDFCMGKKLQIYFVKISVNISVKIKKYLHVLFSTYSFF